jgi:mono/diheme cytochrome c family protein
MNLKVILGFVVVGLLAGLVPFGLIALARSQPSSLPPVHPIQDMYKQAKFRPQHGNPMFADGRAMRPHVPGTSARTDLEINNEMVYDAERPHMIDDSDKPIDLNDELTYRRVTEGTEPGADGKPAYVKKFPVKVTKDLLERGRQRFTINCAICHGQGGYGDGTVALRADQMKEAQGDAAGWVKPKDLHTDDLKAQPVGQIFNTVTNGARSMPAYAKQVSVLDRWAIVAYVKALQRSQNAKPGDVPEAEKEKYK